MMMMTVVTLIRGSCHRHNNLMIWALRGIQQPRYLNADGPVSARHGLVSPRHECANTRHRLTTQGIAALKAMTRSCHVSHRLISSCNSTSVEISRRVLRALPK